MDFIDVTRVGPRGGLAPHVPGTVHWPTFNLADSAIVIGALLLVVDILRPERAREVEPHESAPPREPA